MMAPFPAMRVLTRRLLALEAASESKMDPPQPEALRVLEKLRVSVTRFAGLEGFNALQRRALALARAEAPVLEAMTIGPDGHLAEPEKLFTGADDTGAEAIMAITTQLLALLIAFIGEPLTLRLVREVWPDATPGE
ncbi:MAG: hypothetical protein ABI847_20695 [Anaerolineales bacterium]